MNYVSSIEVDEFMDTEKKRKIFFFYSLSFACLRTNTRNAMPTMTV